MLTRLMVALAGYALGSIPTGYLFVRWRTGRDIRTLGSGATGGRNIARELGPAWGWATGVGDVAKAMTAVGLARRIAPAAWHVAMPAVVAGHVWPVWLGFRGGRGIAPSLGGLLVADPAIGAASLAAFLAGMRVTGETRPAIAAAVAAAPMAAIALRRPRATVAAIIASVGVTVAGHAPNLRRLADRACALSGEVDRA
jgi:glycerol-3-phosphate acyltransferase PlsY